MARRKRKSRKSSSFKSFARRHPRATSGLGMLAYGGYGAFRGKLSSWVKQLSGSFGAGLNVSDEVLMLLASWAVPKFAPGTARYASVVRNIEAFRIGEQIGSGGGLGGLLGGTTTTIGSTGGIAV